MDIEDFQGEMALKSPILGKEFCKPFVLPLSWDFYTFLCNCKKCCQPFTTNLYNLKFTQDHNKKQFKA